jgi:16S rRNA (uracil1498-N3)-methyltransferase
MIRIAIEEKGAASQSYSLTPADWHYVTDVMRLAVGDSLEVSTGDGQVWQAQLLSHGVKLHVPLVRYGLPRREITIYQALLKGDHFSAVVDRATQAGVMHFVPVLAERCIVREVTAVKARRWRVVAKEASEQSRRTHIPDVGELLSLAELRLSPGHEGFVLDPKAEYRRVWLAGSSNPLSLVIGPEGGWTTRELDVLQSRGFSRISLGEGIYRAENAGAFAAILFLQ